MQFYFYKSGSSSDDIAFTAAGAYQRSVGLPGEGWGHIAVFELETQ